MANLDTVCQLCDPHVREVFDPVIGTRKSAYLTGDELIEDRCYVRDEIRFLNTGRLIFVPRDRDGVKRYEEEYFVICRKLVIIGGNPPVTLIPCKADDPGKTYQGNNVITWWDRLAPAPSPNAHPGAAADGKSHDPNNWTSADNPKGNHGADGGDGAPGLPGKDAGTGNTKDAPPARHAPKFTLVALEVEAQLGSHLTIDFDGQNGGRGGRGQNGGDGGNGMGGRDGETDPDWPSADDCERQPGNGGNSGSGGAGGAGGRGGNGGNAGEITIISTQQEITTGPLVSGKVTYVHDGGDGGEGGLGGIGGKAGLFPGKPGFKTSACDPATSGAGGADGSPAGFPNGPGSPDLQGPPGAAGQPAAFVRLTLTPGRCADLIPLPVTVDQIGLQPSMLCRGFASAASADAKLTGQNLGQVTGVATNLAGVTAVVKNSSTDTQLDLEFTIAGNSAVGAGNLTLTRAFGAPPTLPNAVTVQKFQVTGIAPASGARGGAVAVTISGSCFDASALIQTVTASGLGVNALNIVVVNAQTIQCVFDIAGAAPLGARSVTVKTGLHQHTLINAFTVT